MVEIEVLDEALVEALEEVLEILRWRWRDWVLGARVCLRKKETLESFSLDEENEEEKGKLQMGMYKYDGDFVKWVEFV